MPHGGRFGGLFQCCDMSVVVYYSSAVLSVQVYIMRVFRGRQSINNRIYYQGKQGAKLLAYPTAHVHQTTKNGMRCAGSWKKSGST